VSETGKEVVREGISLWVSESYTERVISTNETLKVRAILRGVNFVTCFRLVVFRLKRNETTKKRSNGKKE